METTALILAGGLATRLRPLTEKFPKALIPIHSRPFIAYQLQYLYQQGFRRVVISIGYEGEQIRKQVGDGTSFGLQIIYSEDGPKLLGTGGAVRKALADLSDPFIVLYGDSYLQEDYQKILQTFANQQDSQALMTVYKNSGQFDTSNVQFVDGQLELYDKKNPTAAMDYIDWGLGIIRKSAFQDFADREVFDLAELYTLLARKKKLFGYEVFERFYEIGSRQGIEQLESFLQKRM